MKIRSVKLVKSISQSAVDTDEPLQRPKTPLLSFFRKPVNTGPISFRSGQLHYQGKDVAEIVKQATASDPQLLAKIVTHLQEHKKFQLNRAKKAPSGQAGQKFLQEVGDAVALCDAWLAKLSDSMKSRYDETQTGLHVHFDDDGQLMLNGMNVTLFVETCRENPTPKSRLFLRGVRNRLYYILQNKADARNFERLHEVVSALFDEIDAVLSEPAALS